MPIATGPDPAKPAVAAELLRAHGLRPRKRWGQNFLVDGNVLRRIVEVAALSAEDHVLEIGPGLGALTRRLAEAAGAVTAVEIDPLLRPILGLTLEGLTNVEVLYEDFLAMDEQRLEDLLRRRDRAHVVANIPYYITSPILERLLRHKGSIERITLLVQREVAERLTALPATRDYGALSLFAQYHARVRGAARIPRNVFLPPPEVDSSLVVLEPLTPGTAAVSDDRRLFAVIRAAFAQRRKTLMNALTAADLGLDREAAAIALATAGIEGARRGETLSLAEFARLADALPRDRPAEA